MAWVYMLKSLKDGRCYIGSTINLSQRLKHHLGNFTPSTRRFGGVEKVFSQEFATLKEARLIEAKLKKLKRRDYLEKIIKEGYIKMRA